MWSKNHLFICAQAKLLKNLFEWFQLGFYFYTLFVENGRQGHSCHYGFYWLPLWPLLMENISFLCTINMDLCLHKTEFMERNPCHRRIQKSVWVQPKLFTCIITLISLLIKWNTLIVLLQLVLHFRSLASIIIQFLSPLAGGVGVNLGGRGPWLEKGAHIFDGGFRVYRDSNSKFYFTAFIWVTV